MPNYAQISETLVDHPKTTRAMRLLRVNRLQFIGHLSCLWNWAMKNAADGDLSRFSHRDIADAARWTDADDFDAEADEAATRFVNALLDCRTTPEGHGFLERDEEALLIHDWDEYGGKLNLAVERNTFNKWRERYRARLHCNIADSDTNKDRWRSGLLPVEAGKGDTAPPPPVSDTVSPVVTTSPRQGASVVTTPLEAEQSRAEPSIAEKSSSREESLRGDPAPAAPPGPALPPAPVAAAAESSPNGFQGERVGDDAFLARARYDYPPETWPELWKRVDARMARATRNPAGYVRACLEEHYAKYPAGSTPPLPRSQESRQERDRTAESRIVRAPEALRATGGFPAKLEPDAEPDSAPPNAAFAAARADLAKRLGVPSTARKEPPPPLDPARKREIEAELAERRNKANLTEGVAVR